MQQHLYGRRFSAAWQRRRWILAGPLSAQEDDGVGNSGTFGEGEELYAACTGEDAIQTERCYWYIMGVADSIALFGDYGWLEADGLRAEGHHDRGAAHRRWSTTSRRATGLLLGGQHGPQRARAGLPLRVSAGRAQRAGYRDELVDRQRLGPPLRRLCQGVERLYRAGKPLRLCRSILRRWPKRGLGDLLQHSRAETPTGGFRSAPRGRSRSSPWAAGEGAAVDLHRQLRRGAPLGEHGQPAVGAAPGRGDDALGDFPAGTSA